MLESEGRSRIVLLKETSVSSNPIDRIAVVDEAYRD